MQRGRGGGGKTGGRRPTCLQGGWPDVARQLKKNAVFCRGLAEKPTAEGAALCATPLRG
ncbi:hypothetical protein ID855_21050 [Xenorhabdus sp. ZM]|uniref:hypothetical protein n=1 Tax=Xenorhabdus szentirmaii TaxID=290112 RepID=UPI00199F74C5|nr:hypothetical protein [Xenorhabdus sp. ZM]MBD2807098.1 hypothetical protein [Xenorhabdus sp. ZM]